MATQPRTGRPILEAPCASLQNRRWGSEARRDTSSWIPLQTGWGVGNSEFQAPPSTLSIANCRLRLLCSGDARESRVVERGGCGLDMMINGGGLEDVGGRRGANPRTRRTRTRRPGSRRAVSQTLFWL